MATGFIRYFIVASLAAASVHAAPAAATKVTVVGLFPGKAVVVIDSAPPRTISAGQKTPEGVQLVSTTAERAILEFDGRRETLEIGQHFATPSASGPARVAIAPDGQGHHWIIGQVNGRSTRFLVDTGATTVTLPANVARAAGIDYLKGERGTVQTANGPAAAFRTRADTVTIGDITLYQVDAVVLEAGLESALLGMSFLSRTEMTRDGANLVLIKRF